MVSLAVAGLFLERWRTNMDTIDYIAGMIGHLIVSAVVVCCVFYAFLIAFNVQIDPLSLICR
jgi:hypothetical protein